MWKAGSGSCEGQSLVWEACMRLSGEGSEHCTRTQGSETAGMACISEGLALPEVNAEGRLPRGKGSISGPNKENIISVDTEVERGTVSYIEGSSYKSVR